MLVYIITYMDGRKGEYKLSNIKFTHRQTNNLVKKALESIVQRKKVFTDEAICKAITEGRDPTWGNLIDDEDLRIENAKKYGIDPSTINIVEYDTTTKYQSVKKEAIIYDFTKVESFQKKVEIIEKGLVEIFDYKHGIIKGKKKNILLDIILQKTRKKDAEYRIETVKIFVKGSTKKILVAEKKEQFNFSHLVKSINKLQGIK